MMTIGKVLKPQGTKGELKVLPVTDDSRRFSALKTVLIAEKEYTVTSVRIGGDFVFLKTAEIDDMNAAERLRNQLVAALWYAFSMIFL